jgi:ABC-type transport system involved in Fe-S cluster assembly fused permease/ATPase subunit
MVMKVRTTVGTTTFYLGTASGTNSAPFLDWYRGKRDRGKIMRQIIYGVLPLIISICSMASVIWLLSSFVGFELLLIVGACFVAFASTVALAEELS